jgi:isopenicillin-N epimerase
MKPDKSRRRFLEQMITATVAGVALPLAVTARRNFQLPPTGAVEDESYWLKVKSQFTVPENLHMVNAANLCPSPVVVQDRVAELTKKLNKDVSFQYRAQFSELRKKSVQLLTEFIGATPGEVGITRNTSEANCIIVHGLDLKPDDEVIIWDQNHPSNKDVWMNRSKRIGFRVVQVTTPPNPKSADELVEVFLKAVTVNTKLIAFSQISNLSGIALPAREICVAAKSRSILTLVDGAQSLGLLDVNVSDLQCSFFTSSTHKWLMGPFENGLLYVNKEQISKVWPNTIGAGWKGASTVDENLCVLGQRNEPSTAALPEMIAFHNQIGKENIQERVYYLNDYLKSEIQKQIPKATLVTPVAAEFSAGIVILNLPDKKPADVIEVLYRKYGIAAAPAGGIRLSPHIYNLKKDVDYVVMALKEIAAG